MRRKVVNQRRKVPGPVICRVFLSQLPRNVTKSNCKKACSQHRYGDTWRQRVSEAFHRVPHIVRERYFIGAHSKWTNSTDRRPFRVPAASVTSSWFLSPPLLSSFPSFSLSFEITNERRALRQLVPVQRPACGAHCSRADLHRRIGLSPTLW